MPYPNDTTGMPGAQAPQNPYGVGAGDLAQLMLQRIKMLGTDPKQFAQTAYQAYQNMGQNAIAPIQAATPLDPGARPGLAPEVQAEMPRQAQNPLVEALLRQRMMQGQGQ